MKELDLGKEKISKLLLTFAIPCIISMLINSVYNIVDQIFIGKGVGSIGNAATNVIFPAIIICNSIALLIGNGCAANLSLLLGQGKKKEAQNSVGTAITVLFIASIIVCSLSQLFLPKLLYLFGCTENAYNLSLVYGRIILLGAPFMIIYTGLAALIRSDGSPKYSMICLLSGAIINLILDPIFIFGFNKGVAGGAIATVIGQIVSCIIAVAYLFRTKTIKLELKDYIIDKSIFKTIGYGLSSFIIQMTVLALFVTMNNVMTRYGAVSEYGSDIPLSVYGVVSKLNMIYVALIIGLAVGSQPILGFNYGAGNIERVKETIRKVLITGLSLGLIYNLMLQIFPLQFINLFATKTDPNYDLFVDFGVKCFRIFFMVCALNSFEMICSNIFQSLGKVKKASFVSFLRQIILFLPLCLILSNKFGIMGALYAGPIADAICFVLVVILFVFEYKNLDKSQIKDSYALEDDTSTDNILKDKVIITINREYGSGGRYIGRIIADKLGIKFYDKDLVKIVAEKAQMSEEYVETIEQKREVGANLNAEYNTEDKLFIAQTEAIKEIAQNESCVIVGRCADYILRDLDNVIKVFIYSKEEDKINRVVKYYNIDAKKAKKEIEKVNKERARHYKYYTNNDWNNMKNYDLAFNSDYLGVKETAESIVNIIKSKYVLNSSK